MANAALQMEKFKTIDKLLPPRGQYIYPSGIREKDKGIIRYSLPSSKYPNLIIADPICDDDSNCIMPGYYELVLSDDRQTLVLVQSENVIATFPVFKVEEDKTQENLTQPMDDKSQRKFDKEQKKEDKKNKKLIRQGKMVSEPEVYMNATIQYDEKGGYYLVKYERGAIRAWGAIKL